MKTADVAKHHILTVCVEDYFQVSAFGKLIRPRRWNRFETRVERNTLRALELLDEYGIKATFFVLGWVADRMPEVVRTIAARGHEIASKGYYHRDIEQMMPSEFREDVVRSREALERAGGQRIIGYRVAQGSFKLHDLWALDVLADEGFVYDSSMYPRLWWIADQPWRRFPHEHRTGAKRIWEFPLSTVGNGMFLLPAAGGNYFRQAPHFAMKQTVRYWHKHYAAPFNMYFHIWELDPEIPEITAAGMLTRIRQYRNLDRMAGILRDYFSTYRFGGLADYLGIRPERLTAAVTDGPVPAAPRQTSASVAGGVPSPMPVSTEQRPEITIVVPCHNEELVLPYFANTMDELAEEFDRNYRVAFVFVDDGSTDKTWRTINHLFGHRPNCRCVRHAINRGVAVAILTGIREAATDIVCSLDCDCTYDPRYLLQMIPLLEPGVDLVTASPYHPTGDVENVPPWRLGLSKTLSRLYRAVLQDNTHTYTACFRVYRKAAIEKVQVRHGGFLGVAETLINLELEGGRVVEFPAVLESRLLGESKMKIARTIAGHLGLLSDLTIGPKRGQAAALRQRRRMEAHA